MSRQVSILIATSFFAFLGLTGFLGYLPWIIPGIYVVLTPITMLAYSHDKSAAQQGQWRVAESTLHSLALFGGWPGALIAQQHLRHKTRKSSFQIGFWLTVIANIAVLIWLLTPTGAEELSSLLGSF